MSKRNKRLLIAGVSVLLVAALIVGIVLAVGNKKSPVPVYAVNQLGYQDYYGGDNMEGTVKTDQLQAVYVSGTQEVTEVFVQEGQTVTKGTKLMSYDTTLTELSLENKDLEVQKLKLRLTEAEKELQKIKAMKPIYYHPTKPTAKPTTPPPTEPWVDPYDCGGVTMGNEGYVKVGTLDGFDLYWIKATTALNDGLFAALLDGKTEGNFVLFVREKKGQDENPNGEILVKIGLNVRKNNETPVDPTEPTEVPTEPDPSEQPVPSETLEPYRPSAKNGGAAYTYTFCAAPEATEPEEPQQPTEAPGPDVDWNSGYTASEIAQMRKDKEKEIKDLNLNIRMSEAEYKIMKAEFNDGTVYAQLDGTVVGLTDPETARASGTPLMKISGGGSYLIEGNVSEFDLGKVQVGTTVEIQDYWYGGTYTGTVIEVKDTPSENNYYGGNSNVSYYPFIVRIDESANLEEYGWVQMRVAGTGEEQASLYLEKAFIRQEGGQSYVYARNADGLLERRNVLTGQDNGYALAIQSGLSLDDYIAFPYGKDVKDGAPTVEGDPSELYNVTY